MEWVFPAPNVWSSKQLFNHSFAAMLVSVGSISSIVFAAFFVAQPSICRGQFLVQIADSHPDEPDSSSDLVQSSAAETDVNLNGDTARKAAIERCLSVYYTRQIDADILRPWSLMHGMLAYGPESRVIAGNQSLSAAEYLSGNGQGNDRKLMMVHNGKLHLPIGPGYQGHAGQLLAIFAQSGVPVTQPLTVDGQSFTVQDLVDYEKSKCEIDTELTFRLIGLSHYLDSESTWENEAGQEWSIARLIEQELNQPITTAACGGAHRLMGLSYAIVQRENESKPLNAHWAAAATYISEFQEYTFSLQNENGSFSTDFFEGPSDKGGANAHLLATGHILEWMVYSLPSEELDDPRLAKGVDFLVNLMLAAPDYKLDVGPRGHALRALVLYEAKIFGSSDHAQLMPKGITRIRNALTAESKELRNRAAFQVNANTRTVPAHNAKLPAKRTTPNRSSHSRRLNRR